MRKKLIGTTIFLTLVLTLVPVFGANPNENVSVLTTESDLVLELYPTPSSIGLNMDIENTGLETVSNVDWSFRYKAAITGTGWFIREKLQIGNIDQIAPGEKITIKFRPFFTMTKSPLGFGTVYMNASAKFDDVSVRTQKQARLFGYSLVRYKDTYMDIKPDEAYEKWLNEEFDLIIDVVGLDIYSLGHLPGAVNYVWADGTLNNMIPTLDKNLTYLVYCHTDPPSTASAQAMVNAGFENIYRLEGNFKAWKDAGYPIET